MFRKGILFLLTLILIALSMSCICAHGLDNSTAGDLKLADNFNDLSDIINRSVDDEIVYLENDYRTTDSSDQIIISKPMTIDGRDHSIEAPDVERVFLVKADNVCIKNINFINSKSTGLAGGVISWLGNNGTLEGCNFTNNSASSAGGALCWMGDGGSISNCNFNSNNVDYGPALSLTSGESFDSSSIHIQVVNSEGGAVHVGGNGMSISGCNFYNNTALLNGGAISTSWTNGLSIDGCRFKRNGAVYSGGAIDLNSDNVIIANSKFYNNSPNDLFANSNNLTIANSSFKNESCISSWQDINYADVSFGPFGFDDLADEISGIPQGGLLVLDSDYQFLNGTDTGIVISKSITIDGAGHTLDGNKLSRIFNVTADNVTLKNINFINGNALGSYGIRHGGGAIYWNGSDGTVENCTFTGNALYSFEFDPYEDEVTNDGEGLTIVHTTRPDGATTCQGGAISWMADNGKVINSTFSRNSVGYANDGGAIYWAGSNGNIINSEFYANDAFRGAAIYWNGENGTISLSKFINTGICDNGIFWMGENGVIKNSLLINIDGRIGVISPYSVKVAADYNYWGDTLENPNLVNKSENVKYWVLMDYSPDRDYVFEGEGFTVSYNFNKIITKNGQVYGYGGLASKAGSVVLTSNGTGLLNLTFAKGFNVDVIPYNSTGDFYDLLVKIHNTPEGGTLVLDEDYEYVNGTNKGILISKPVTIDGAGHTLNGNKLSRIFNITSDNVTVRNVNFINGNAYGQYYAKNIGGGAIYWSGANGFLENCNFTRNEGSGIENDPFETDELILMDNGAVLYTVRMRPMGAKINEGGAIVWNGTNGSVSKCVFIKNGVGYPNAGGAICWRGDFGKVIESEFYENNGWCGSAIAWMGDNGTILSSTFANTSFFGDIYWFGENGVIRNSILLENNQWSVLAPSDADVDADYNFWGDTLSNPNSEYKIDNVKKWLVMTFTHNGEFVKKGQTVVIDWDITDLVDKNGKVTKYYKINKSGQLTYTAVKDGYLDIGFANGKVNVNIDTKDKIISKDQTGYYKSKTTYKVSVSDMNGKVAGKYVKFTVNGKTYKVKTNKNGVATLKVNLKPGKYTVNVAYGSAKVKSKITVKTTLITKNLSKKAKKVANFKVKVLNSKGKAFAKKTVKIKFKGKTYKIKTGNNGIATFKVPKNLKVGKYTIKTTYNGLTNTNKITVKK